MRGKASPPVALGEADIAVGADDDVIEYRDAAKITDLTKSRGELDVGSAGGSDRPKDGYGRRGRRSPRL